MAKVRNGEISHLSRSRSGATAKQCTGVAISRAMGLTAARLPNRVNLVKINQPDATYSLKFSTVKGRQRRFCAKRVSTNGSTARPTTTGDRFPLCCWDKCGDTDLSPATHPRPHQRPGHRAQRTAFAGKHAQALRVRRRRRHPQAGPHPRNSGAHLGHPPPRLRGSSLHPGRRDAHLSDGRDPEIDGEPHAAAAARAPHPRISGRPIPAAASPRPRSSTPSTASSTTRSRRTSSKATSASCARSCARSSASTRSIPSVSSATVSQRESDRNSLTQVLTGALHSSDAP
jgi:hypothetical protein